MIATGCVVGPDYQRPDAPTANYYLSDPLPEQTTSRAGANGVAQVFIRSGNVQADWYRLFRCAALNDLIHTALNNSPTLAAGRARLRAAREDWQAERGRLLPQISAGLGASHQRVNGSMIGLSDPMFSNIFTFYEGRISLNYDLDLFGLAQRGIEGERARLEIQRYRLLDSYLTLTNNVVATALAEVGIRAQLQATRELVRIQSESLDLLRAQEQYGAVARNTVLRAQAQLAQIQAQLPPLEKQLSTARHRLAVLTGTPPANFSAPNLELTSFRLPRELPVSLPSDLVRQRPDILAAESLVHVTNADIGVADARLLPQLNITGALGREALTGSGLFDPVRTIYNLGAGLSAPLFQGGQLRARKRAAQARHVAAVADYQATVLRAFGEVADQLQALQSDATHLVAQQHALDAARANLDLVREQLHHGLIDNLELFTAQNLYQQALIKQTDARVQRYLDTAALFRSLGGGWWTQAPDESHANTAHGQPAAAAKTATPPAARAQNGAS